MRIAVRPVLVLVAVLAVGAAAAAHAAPAGPRTLSFSDPAGDNVSPSKASDITGVTFTTAGSGKGKTYVAKKLVLTMTLAAPPAADGMTVYGIDTQLAGCGQLYVQYMPGANILDSFNFADCAESTDPTGTSDGGSFPGAPEVKGSSIVWTFALKSLPGSVKPGSTFSEINAYTDFVDPALSIVGPYSVAGVAVYDTAATEKPYQLG